MCSRKSLTRPLKCSGEGSVNTIKKIENGGRGFIACCEGGENQSQREKGTSGKRGEGLDAPGVGWKKITARKGRSCVNGSPREEGVTKKTSPRQRK